MLRTGSDYIRSLQDERSVFVNGSRVESVSASKAFANAVRSIARLYDFQCQPENLDLMTVETKSGTRINRGWQLPTSYQELVRRRDALVAWAELHNGFMGRSPDHVASTIAAMAMGYDIYERYKGGRAGAVRDFYHYASESDLYLSYVIIDPQGNRSKGTGDPDNADLAVSICDEDTEGITVRGAKMLGTGAIMSNEVLLSTLRPLKPEEERFALTAAVPLNAKGVKLLSRRSYEDAASSHFDYPLSTQFDENDAVIYFDETKIPWERVFVHRDVGAQLAQWHETPAHSYQNYQSEIRLMVKLRFLAGLARKITETIGTINFPPVRETLGEISSYVGTVEALVYGMEAKGSKYGRYFVPDSTLLYAAQVQSQMIYPRVIHLLRELSGGGLIMLPSVVDDFDNPEIRPLIQRTQYSATGSAVDRVKLFKLAWDAVGSEFASRHTQYEMFYSGPRNVTTGMAFRTFNWEAATGQVDRLLATYDLRDRIKVPDSGLPSLAGVGAE